MKKKKKIIQSALSIAAMLGGSQAIADHLPVPTGPDIQEMASACPIGPFGQTSKAGPYNRYCLELTDAEKCLALVKGSLTHRGELLEAHQGKARYCIDEFKRGLLGEEEQ